MKISIFQHSNVGEDVIMAHGDTEIYDEDHLIVFYKNKDVIDNFYNAFR